MHTDVPIIENETYSWVERPSLFLLLSTNIVIFPWRTARRKRMRRKELEIFISRMRVCVCVCVCV
jgi:hypothetical protein